MSGPKVVAIVAARNEAATISQVVKELYQLPAVGRVVVAVDGSTDATADEALAARATVLVSPVRKGKGGAVEAALDRTPGADVYVLVDGDVGPTAAEAGALLGEVVAGRADLAIGMLPPQAGGGFGLVKLVARWLIQRASGFVAEEPLSGQRAATGGALDGCRPLARGFGLETAMTIDAVRLGFRVVEVPVAVRHRPHGRSVAGFVHRGRQGVEILRAALPRLLGLR